MRISDLQPFELIRDPLILYHGTKIANLVELVPAYSELIDTKGVFATPYKGIAIVMSQKWTDDDFDFGYDEGGPLTLTELKPNKLEEVFGPDCPKAYIYTVLAEEFSNPPELQNWEMVSYDKIPVLAKETIEDHFTLMEVNGIHVVRYSE